MTRKAVILVTIFVLHNSVTAGRVSDEVHSVLSKRSRNNSWKTTSEPLSAYELAMFVDLVIQISMIRCPQVSRPGIKSLKQFMFSSFSKTPQKAVAHPLFYANYRSLVECMTYAQDHFPKGSLGGGSAVGSLEDMYQRRRRSISEEFNGLIPAGGEGFEKFKTKASFQEFFVSLQSITEMTCPSNLVPNKAFLAASLEEAATWVRTHDMAKHAHEKYFRRGGMLKDVVQCYEKLR